MNARPSTLPPQSDLPVVPDDSEETSPMSRRINRTWTCLKCPLKKRMNWMRPKGLQQGQSVLVKDLDYKRRQLVVQSVPVVEMMEMSAGRQ